MPRALLDPDTLSASLRRSIRAQCDGDWDRVTVDDDGSFMVHNNPFKAQKYVDDDPAKNHGSSLGDSPESLLTTESRTTASGVQPGQLDVAVAPPRSGRSKTQRRPRSGETAAPKAPPAAPTSAPTSPEEPTTRRYPEAVTASGKVLTDADIEALAEEAERGYNVRDLVPRNKERQPAPQRSEAELRGAVHLIKEAREARDNDRITPGVNVVQTRTAQDKERDERNANVITSEFRGEIDWAKWDIEASAHKLLELCRNGLPPEVRFTIKMEVYSVWGLDLSAVEDCLHQPQRVEIRPQSYEATKRYPILGFYRGDVSVILGMRIPSRPQVIAVYVDSKLMPDQHRPTDANNRSGGGGSKKAEGLPVNVKQSVRALRNAGAEIDLTPAAMDEGTVTVSHKGQDLGKIQVGERVPRQQVQSDYQRMLRKINAINQREANAS